MSTLRPMEVDTSTDSDHPHAHGALVDIDGNGVTTPGGPDNHVHKIVEYEVLPWTEDEPNPETHAHRILDLPLRTLRMSNVGRGTGRAPTIRHPSMSPKSPNHY